MLNIAVLVSGGGSNLQALINAVEAGGINGRIVTVVSNKPGVYALERAKKHSIPFKVIPDGKDFDSLLVAHLKENKADLVVLAGFLRILGKEVLDAFPKKIINVHPSLIPSFCGDGFYGLKVHRAALDYGVKVTGATVHYVNDITDGGEIISQKAVCVKPDDTPETLQRRVMEEAEWVILPQAVADICNKERKDRKDG
ncbi:MAG: Phosphoribosylglycinamide formyltransferase [Firmicutes bacterium ADurb.Bin193]|nr:MAG: Phosphoribosylglycinamide formyltransferase [Firmicutes bacterium ADurb.Bin193]